MKYLLFLISFLYSFWFYIFYVLSNNKNIFWQDLEHQKNILTTSVFDPHILSNSQTMIIQSFFWDLRIEIIFFFLVWIFFFFYFWSLWDNSSLKKTTHFSFITKKHFVLFLQKFSYYIWFLLFYFSIYLISKWIDFFEFSGFILMVNILILIFFFLSKYSKITLDFLKINSILFSVTYIFWYISLFITDEKIFSWIDSINSVFILFTFWILIFFDKQINKKESYDYTLVAHFSIYFFFVCLFYLYFYVLNENLFYWIVWICSIFWIIWFEWLPKISFFSSQIKILRYIWILFSYFWVILWMIYLCIDSSISVLFLVLTQIWYHLFIHQKYTNVISFWLSVLWSIFVLFYILFELNFISIHNLSFFLLSFILSYGMVISTYFFKGKTLFDIYIIHISAHILNVIWILIFLFFHYKNLQVFYIWILLFLESFYFFLSYHKLHRPILKWK